jgi:CheY-like chemotaxis protein
VPWLRCGMHEEEKKMSTDEEAQPGRRSGSGASSIWAHMNQDAQRKTAAGAQPVALRPPDRANFTVLVVDDTPAARYALARTLQSAGYKTVSATGGAEALQLAGEVSACVLDVHLPDLHGMEVCRMLRARSDTAALPIIHVSAVYVDEVHREEATRTGADAYLIAPVPPEDLIQVVDFLIARANIKAP